MATPTTKDINNTIISQLETSFATSVPWLPKAFLRVLSKTLAGVFVTLYKYGGFIFLQIFIKTASAQDTTVNGRTVNPLTFWCNLVGAGSPVAATQARHTVNVTVTNQTGFLTSGSQLVNTQNGVTYLTLTDVALDAPTVEVTVVASSDQAGGDGAGTIGNLADGATLSFANPLPNVGRDATVTGQTVAGADAETTEAYRQRGIDRFQKRPQGGASADYEIWGEEGPGIASVYPYSSPFPGQVDLYVEAVTTPAQPYGVPTDAQLEAVLAGVTGPYNAPITALPNAHPITRTFFDVVVSGLDVADPAAVRASITSAVLEYFLAAEPYIDGLSVPPRKDRVTEAAVTSIVSDIVSSVAGIFTGVTLSTGGVQVSIYTLGVGEKAAGNEPTFI